MAADHAEVLKLEGASAATNRKAGRTVIRSIYVTKAGGAGSLLKIIDDTSGTTGLFTVEGEAVQSLPNINKRLSKGLRTEVTTGGNYLIVYE